MRLVDTHLHLEEVGEDAVTEAVASGVARMITMGVDLITSRGALARAQGDPAVFAAAGHHATNQVDPELGEFRSLCRESRVVAVGEIGLDGSLGGGYAPMARQVAWFEQLCDIALEHDLPVSVHVREAEELVYRVLRARPGLRGVMHYFSLDGEWADRFLDLGLHLSFAGLVTRPSRDALREVARRCPADRLLLETDSPYGLPHIRRREAGNRPAFLVDTAALIADLRAVSLSELAELEWNNAHTLFKRMAGAT